MQNQYFTIQENYKERFYQIPKVFFTSNNYKDLTNDMKIGYAILRDRLNLSIKNNWIDEDGNIYFIYSNEKLMEILNCGKEKLTKIKKGLENAGLLIQKRRGLNKPNILYLMKPVVTECDIYKIEKEENDVEAYSYKEVRKSNFQKFENRTSEVRKSNANDTDFNNTDFNNTDFNDMNGVSGNNIDSLSKINDHSTHTNHENNNYLIDEQKHLLKPLPEELQKFIKSRYSLADSVSIINKIMQAKRAAANRRDDGMFFMFEGNEKLSQIIIDILIAVNREMKKKREPVQALLGYYYNALVNGLEEFHFTEKAKQALRK
ncbi:replication initiator protein A [Staphylococcus aureus]|nr:replication initiator protein A [Staphylococcus aureus]